MYYWSVTTVSRDFCKRNGSIVTPIATDDNGWPNTVEYGDMTFTSPSTYIILPMSISAIFRTRSRQWHNCGAIGKVIFLTVEPSDLRTVVNHGPYAHPTFGVDRDDFNTMRYEAYRRAFPHNNVGHAINTHRGTIYDYTPRFQIPISAMGGDAVPDWENFTEGMMFQPIMIPITPGMTTTFSDELDGLNRHKIISIAKPTAAPSHNLPWSTSATGTFFPTPTSAADSEVEGME
ncbi:hypothetical protein G7Y89_g7800 [Cudoniella acicularis]|uniref:Uncharacterized protein n=1 Tax=Cudoniella acicularis TaxID=354080 RepID=A0A8H4RK42_9HELO|nr:hypothetical protein G7Y89_g7800 [Cudoniella acicularis]